MTNLATLHASEDYLTHEKLWIHSLKTSLFDYRNAYFLFEPGRWRGINWDDIRNCESSALTLVLGHSDNDVSLPMLETLRKHTEYSRFFASNLTPEASREGSVFDLPIGIPNDERQSKTHIVQSDSSLIKKAWGRTRKLESYRKPRVYANFSIRNNPQVRGEAREALDALPDAVVGKFKVSKRARLEDLVLMGRCGLVMCPRGAGMDTHRFWECLLVGSVPIVLEGDHSARLAQRFQLPHIALSSWKDAADTQYLENEWQNFNTTVWDYSALSASYWQQKILG